MFTVLLNDSRGRILSGLVLLELSIPAAAQPEWSRGWYAGGGLTAGNVFAVEGSGYTETSERGNSDTGFVINGGFRWNRHVAFEIGYLDGGTPTFDTIAIEACGTPVPCQVDASQDTNALDISAVGILPIKNVWEIYMKGGIAIWDASSRLRITPLIGGSPETRTIDADGRDFVLGIGAGVMIGDHSHLRLEYRAFRTDDALLELDSRREARFDQIALEFHWRF